MIFILRVFGQLTVSNGRLFFESITYDRGSCGLQGYRQVWRCREGWAAVESEEAGKGSTSRLKGWCNVCVVLRAAMG